MTHPRFLALLALLGAPLLKNTDVSAEPGTGTPQIDRLPWRAGQSVQLTQGWFGHYSHQTQWGEDWGSAGAFTVLAVAEGDATCVHDQGGSGGEYISVARSTNGITSNWTDWYFHLDDSTCGPDGWTRHVQQGDPLALAGCTGSCTGTHLHYEPRTGGLGTSVYHWESGIDNFCDHNDLKHEYPLGEPPNPMHDGQLDWTCLEAHSDMETGGTDEWYASDNAGPGMRSDGSVIDRIRNAYVVGGVSAKECLLIEGDSSWDCYGSSMKLGGVGYGPFAFQHTHAGDPGWHQWFQTTAGAWHGMNLPDACTETLKAYVIPLDYFWAWYFNADQLGQARTNLNCPEQGHCLQGFRYGVLESTAYGQSPQMRTGPGYERTSCE